MDNNDRFLGNEEVISLLKKLNVITKDMLRLENKILSILDSFNGHFGNPYDKESMANLFWLLDRFNVDLSSDKNKKIIHEFIFEKCDRKKVVTELGEDNYFKRVNKLDVLEKDIDDYVSLLVLELGFKPCNMGFLLFKEGVIYFYYNSSKIKSSKDIYLYLANKYNLDISSVERVIRQNLKSAKNNHLDNVVCRYVYDNKKPQRVVDAILNTVSFIKKQDEFIILRENKDILNSKIYKDLELDNLIELLLNRLNVSKKLVGYNYLVDLIYLVLDEESNEISWVDMYKRIALKYNKSDSSIERDIRFLIDSSYFKNSNDEFNKYIYGEGKRSSISKFVSNVIDYIKLVNIDNNLNIDNELEKNVRYLLHKIGISSNWLGYNYLFDMIMLGVNEKGLVSWSNLYEVVASKYGVDSFKVERGIRNSITRFKTQFLNISYEDILNSDKVADVVKFLYRYCDDFNNSIFISYLIQYIKLTSDDLKIKDYEYLESNSRIKKVKTKI